MIFFLLLGSFLACVLGLGIRSARGRRQGLAEYFLAGRNLSLPFFVMTLVPTFYGGVLGVGEFTWRYGLSNWTVMAAPYYFFAAFYALFLAGRVRLNPGLSLPDHIEGAYGRKLALLSAGLVFILASPADEILMFGSLLSYITGIRLLFAMVAGGIFTLVLLRRGGFRADVWANSLEFALMFGGFFLILPFAAAKFGGPSFFHQQLPAQYLSFSGNLSPLRIAAWWLIAAWTLVDPSFHQRCAAAKDPATARLGIFISILFWALFDLMTTAAGLYARAALPSLQNPVMAFPALAASLLPPMARALFFIGLASSILAALQGKSLLSAVSLGKDVLGRYWESTDEASYRFSMSALWLVVLAAIALGLAMPSVVALWYAIGSAVIPGLLWPTLGIYFPIIRIEPFWAVTASTVGWVCSVIWLVLGVFSGHSPFGLEPMIVGLALSTLLWAIGKLRASFQ